jgi:23S rRNA (adenine2030-N6)-methyltransferase
MNYRHAFHAGNFADVLKHILLCRILAHLRQKPTGFRVIDTHAGAGLYDLAGDEAARGGEWGDGIARLRAASLRPEAAALLAPYLGLIATLNPGPALTRYPGSPALAQSLLRPQDRLVACELEPIAAATLTRSLAGDVRCKALRLDGWIALRAQVPPKERRGIVVIDPPFERPDEFARLERAAAAAHRKWASGIFMLWYPVKERDAPERLIQGMQQLDAGLLRIELSVGRAASTGLVRCGLIVLNPPWTLESELAVLLPELVRCLGDGGPGAGFRLDRLDREK